MDTYSHMRNSKSMTRSIRQKMNRSFLNETGPGDYEVHTQIGSEGERFLSNNRTTPFYSMAVRHTGSVISKDHYQDWVGKDTPGVGQYKEKSYTDNGPKFSVIQDPRFYVPKKATHLADHAYHTPV